MAAHSGPKVQTDTLVVKIDPLNVKNYSGSSTTLYDKKNNITMTLAQSVTSGIINSINSAVTIPSTSALNTDTHSIFFFIRFNTTVTYGANGYSGSWDKILSFNAGGSDRSPSIWRWPSERTLHWRYDPGNTGCDFGKNGLGTGYQFDIDKWYHVGVTKNGATATSYVNGISLGTSTVANPKTAGNAPIIIFEYYPTGLASFSSLKVYSSVLTDFQVRENFNALRGRFGI